MKDKKALENNKYKKKKISCIAAVILAVVMLFSVSAAVFAVEGGDGYSENTPAENGEGENPGGETPDNGETPPDYTATEAEPTEAPADNGDGGNGYDEVIAETVPTEAEVTQPADVNDLPAVDYYDVFEATAVVLPDVEISDASLFSGIVMWLCVAVGIAVVVGVMVSKRTRRRG